MESYLLAKNEFVINLTRLFYSVFDSFNTLGGVFVLHVYLTYFFMCYTISKAISCVHPNFQIAN